MGLAVKQQVPGDGQYRWADRDDRLLLAAPPGDPSVAVDEEGVGAAGADGGFAEGSGQVGVCRGRVLSLPLLRPADSFPPGTNLAHDAMVPGGRGSVHVQPDLGDVAAHGIDAREHVLEQEGVMLGERADERLLQCADLASHRGAGQLRQHLRVTLLGDQRVEHTPDTSTREVAKPQTNACGRGADRDG